MKEKNIKNLCFCLMPAIIGIILIFISILNYFNLKNLGCEENSSVSFFYVFLGMGLISHSIVSVLEICKQKM